jgi:tryptophan synthase alpha chain
MNRIASTFSRLRETQKKALVIYLTAGDPDVPGCVAAAVAAVRAGADILEIGVPFSDPVADGPVIQRAMLRSLRGGGGIKQTLDVIRKVRAACPEVPIVAFGYVNPLLWDGLEASCAALRGAGADGLLVVDVPSEEAGGLRQAVAGAGLAWVPLITPTTGAERAARIAATATGFVYMVSMTGVTGGALSDVGRLAPLVEAAHRGGGVPVCMGFGVRDRQSAARAAAVADGVVVGSAVVAALEAGTDGGRGAADVGKLVGELRGGVDGR